MNPAHLFLGTRSDNVADMLAKGRGVLQRRTHCPQGHPYDDANTLVSKGRRYCRTCLYASNRRYATRKRAERSG